MKIKRAGNQVIELTPEELEMAYREQLHNYRREDAQRQLLDNFDDEEDPTAFSAQYGRSIEELAENNEFLDQCVEEYEHDFDCNNAENDMWEAAIRETLKTWEPRCEAILIQMDVDDGLTPEDIISIVTDLGAMEMMPVEVHGENNSWAFGFMYDCAADEKLNYDMKQFCKEVAEVLDDANLEHAHGLYYFAGVHTKIVYRKD